MKVRGILRTVAIVAAALGVVAAWPAAAAPIVVEFTATVTSVSSTPSGETWGGRVVPLGSEVTGRYRYEINPANPHQVINSTFEVAFGSLSWATTIHSFDVLPHTPSSGDGDRYQVLGVLGGIYPGGDRQTLEQFVIQLQSLPYTTAGLTLDAFTEPPDFADFAIHWFVYTFGFMQPNETYVHLEATLTSLRLVAIATPPALPLFLSGILGMMFCYVRRAARRPH